LLLTLEHTETADDADDEIPLLSLELTLSGCDDGFESLLGAGGVDVNGDTDDADDEDDALACTQSGPFKLLSADC
jgi:hypothetical protein